MLVRSVPLGLFCCVAAACSAKTASAPETETAQVEPAPPAAPVAEAEQTTSPMQRVHVRLGVAELGGVFAGVEKVSQAWSPDSTLDLTGQLQAMLLQLGFGPGFYESFDMRGRTAFDIQYPHTTGSPRPQDIGIAGTIPTTDARRLIQGMPPAYQPQPLSEGMWQLIDEGFQVLLREQPKALELAARESDFQLAGQLLDQMGSGRRIRAHASNLPKDELDPASLLGLGMDARQSKMLAGILAELTQVQFELDIGDDRDVEMALGATAPFAKLGLDPIGAPMQQPSSLAQTLPDGAVAALVLSWGDPTLLHAMIDREVPLNQIPVPFNELAAAGVDGIKSTLNAVRDEVIFAFYLSPKGEATIVLAAKTKDEATTRAALRKLFDTGKRAFDAHLTLVGQDPQQRYTVKYKQDGVRVARHKADQFSVSVPKSMTEQTKDLSMFLGKKQVLEIVSLAADDTAIVAIGAGARRLMTDIGRSLGKTRKSSLESAGGLALARRTTDGCQLCIIVDPIEALATRLQVVNAGNETSARSQSLRSLSKLGSLGQLAFSTVVNPDSALVGFAAPQALLFAAPETTKTVREAWDQLEDTPSADETPPAPATGG